MGALRLTTDEASELAGHFEAIVEKVPLREISSPAEYDDAVRALDGLLDAGGADEAHPLAGLVAALGRFIGDYDERVRPDDDSAGA